MAVVALFGFVLFIAEIISPNTGVTASCTVGKHLQGILGESFSFEMLYGYNWNDSGLNFTIGNKKIVVEEWKNQIQVEVSYRGRLKETRDFPRSLSWGWKNITIRCNGNLSIFDDETGEVLMPLESLIPCKPADKKKLNIKAASTILTVNCRQGNPVWMLSSGDTMSLPLNFSDPQKQMPKYQVLDKDISNLRLQIHMNKFRQPFPTSSKTLVEGSSSPSLFFFEFQNENMKRKLIWPGGEHVFDFDCLVCQTAIKNMGNSTISIKQLIRVSELPHSGENISYKKDKGTNAWMFAAIFFILLFLAMVVLIIYFVLKLIKAQKEIGNRVESFHNPNQESVHHDEHQSTSTSTGNNKKGNTGVPSKQPLPIPSFPNIAASPGYENICDNQRIGKRNVTGNANNIYQVPEDINEEHIYEEVPGVFIAEVNPEDENRQGHRIYCNINNGKVCY